MGRYEDEAIKLKVKGDGKGEANDTAEGEVRRRPPPLLRLSIFQRAHGKLAVMVCIAFFVWAGFSGWNFYAVVCPLSFALVYSRKAFMLSDPSYYVIS